MIKSKSKGFSLIELMIVVAIIAILAAIAIPNFMKFSMKAKTSEATTNLAAIRTSQESYRSENDVYLPCGPCGDGDDATPDVFLADPAGFDMVGFAPDGKVRYQYTVDEVPAVAGATPPHFMASALGDLDEDGLSCVFGICTADPDYPKVQKNPSTSGVVLVGAGALAWTVDGADDF